MKLLTVLMNNIIILAAGKGTRMDSDLPKVLVKLQEKPMITHLLGSIEKSGVDMKVIIVASPDNQEMIGNALHEFDISIALQREQLGTGHAVSCAQNSVSDDADYVIVFYGDHPLVQPETIQRLHATIQENGSSPIIMMTTTVDNYEGDGSTFLHWGRIIREDGQIKQIVEYKDATEEQREIKEVNPGFYCFKNSWLWENIDKLENNNHQKEFYLTDLIKIAVDQGEEILDIPVDSWQTIGVNSKEELQRAEQIYKDKVK